MEAPYLILDGKKAMIGQPYWTVNIANNFDIREHVADRENNVQYCCYFDNKDDAVRYQNMGRLLMVLAPQVREIEQRFQGNGFRRKKTIA